MGFMLFAGRCLDAVRVKALLVILPMLGGLLLASCTFSQMVPERSHDIVFDVQVQDEQKRPLDGVKVYLAVGSYSFSEAFALGSIIPVFPYYAAMDSDLALSESFCLALDSQGKGRLDFTMKFPERAYLIFARDGYHRTLLKLPMAPGQEGLTLTLLDARQWCVESRYLEDGLVVFKRGNCVIVSKMGRNHFFDEERNITCFHPDEYAHNAEPLPSIKPLPSSHSIWWRDLDRALPVKGARCP